MRKARRRGEPSDLTHQTLPPNTVTLNLFQGP